MKGMFQALLVLLFCAFSWSITCHGLILQIRSCYSLWESYVLIHVPALFSPEKALKITVKLGQWLDWKCRRNYWKHLSYSWYRNEKKIKVRVQNTFYWKSCVQVVNDIFSFSTGELNQSTKQTNWNNKTKPPKKPSKNPNQPTNQK